MKWSISALCGSSILAISLAAFAQEPMPMMMQPPTKMSPAAPAPPRVNSALVPNLSQGFQAKHTQNLNRIKEGEIDVLFIGDSITDGWRNTGRSVFDKYYGSMKVGNFGIGGDTTQGVLWRLQNGEGTGYKPKAVMQMIGTNNTGRNSPIEIAMANAAIVFELRKDFPDAKILLLGIFPRGAAASAAQRPQIAEINRIISTLHDNSHVFYLDIGQKFLSEDGSIARDVMADQLHPTAKGYEIWAEAVKEPLANLMK